ncbi:hypothetical protein [Spongiactinospora sp. TRM90649]|uniref:hypothetical protein n=1 Tax=Spongiactinospora sp. TRM90649 TaxID=3031114 RepID=UPI0023F8FF40|nr:hypothetical protein [Spongiactinospora sp. TRM90649]MDF5753306.1 hypothetical protein [Spongiactinospora sp. TRM90649]
MSEAAAAMGKLRAELTGLGVTDAYEVCDESTLSVWIGLVVCFRDGDFRWREGTVRHHHPGSDPVGCAVRVARRYAELQADVPPWWEDLARILRGESAQDYP